VLPEIAVSLDMGGEINVAAVSQYTNAQKSDCAASIFSKLGPSR
jgi:hypothetical protein